MESSPQKSYKTTDSKVAHLCIVVKGVHDNSQSFPDLSVAIDTALTTTRLSEPDSLREQNTVKNHNTSFVICTKLFIMNEYRTVGKF